jgi:hypothetical protein
LCPSYGSGSACDAGGCRSFEAEEALAAPPPLPLGPLAPPSCLFSEALFRFFPESVEDDDCLAAAAADFFGGPFWLAFLVEPADAAAPAPPAAAAAADDDDGGLWIGLALAFPPDDDVVADGCFFDDFGAADALAPPPPPAGFFPLDSGGNGGGGGGGGALEGDDGSAGSKSAGRLLFLCSVYPSWTAVLLTRSCRRTLARRPPSTHSTSYSAGPPLPASALLVTDLTRPR